MKNLVSFDEGIVRLKDAAVELGKKLISIGLEQVHKPRKHIAIRADADTKVRGVGVAWHELLPSPGKGEISRAYG